MKKLISGILWMFLITILAFSIYIAYYNYTKVDRQIIYREVIQKELKETGKLLVLEGTTQYITTREETKKLPGTNIEIGSKTIVLDLQLKYGYSVDLSAIKVEVSDDVVLTVDSDSVVLDYVYLDLDNSFIESRSTLLVKSYTPEEINEIQKACIQDMRDELVKNEENLLKARESLENQLKLLIGKITNFQVIIYYQQ